MNDNDTVTTTVEKDEEIARALQEQFRAEAETETAKSVAASVCPNDADAARRLDQEESDAAPAADVPSRPDGELHAAAALASSACSNGVDVTWRVDQEEGDASPALDVPSRPDGELHAAAAFATAARPDDANDADDAAVARRLDQEDRDAALAVDVSSRPCGEVYSTDDADDEAAARRLDQEESDAAPAVDVSSRPDGELYTASPFASSDDADNADDEALARRLEQEESDAALAADVSSRPYGELYTAAPFASADDADNADDEAVAWRLEQEERDDLDAELAADLARRLARGTGRARRWRRRPRARASRLPLRRLLCDTCCAGALLVVAAFLFVRALHRGAPFYWPDGGGDRDPAAHDPADWFQGGDWEPLGHMNGGSEGWITAWRSSSDSFDGLHLKVLNNLDDKWQGTFSSVMDDWENGTPDAVTLQIERTSDPACAMVPGAMVVCNGNYGRTDWRGLNELHTEKGRLVASVAKLNDYFLDGAAASLRRYVCCHEVGHGLGLGHTVEDPHNPDPLECMDYTAHQQSNTHPGRTNFELLERMYGNVDGTSVRENLQERPPRRSRPHGGNYSDNGRERRMMRRVANAEHYESDPRDGVKIRRVLLLA